MPVCEGAGTFKNQGLPSFSSALQMAVPLQRQQSGPGVRCPMLAERISGGEALYYAVSTLQGSEGSLRRDLEPYRLDW